MRFGLVLIGYVVLLAEAAAFGAQAAARRGAPPAKSAERPAAGSSEPSRAEAASPPAIPKVLLSKLHESLCRVKVGDTMPEIKLALLGGKEAELAKLNGERATVVVFWKSDRRMSRTLLADLGPDVLDLFGPQGVAVIGIAVDESAASAKAAMTKAAARFPMLLDPGGKAFALVGSDKLPRVYLLDPQGKVLWFDIEYSLSTRRELNQALRAVVRVDPVSK